jgi:hypothetical protein
LLTHYSRGNHRGTRVHRAREVVIPRELVRECLVLWSRRRLLSEAACSAGLLQYSRKRPRPFGALEATTPLKTSVQARGLPSVLRMAVGVLARPGQARIGVPPNPKFAPKPARVQPRPGSQQGRNAQAASEGVTPLRLLAVPARIISWSRRRVVRIRCNATERQAQS